jgi:WD40 repeat protein
VAFSPDGKAIAGGSEDNSVWLWDIQTGAVLHTLASLSGAEKSPEVLLSYQQPGGQGRALRGSVIAGIPQT